MPMQGFAQGAQAGMTLRAMRDQLTQQREAMQRQQNVRKLTPDVFGDSPQRALQEIAGHDPGAAMNLLQMRQGIAGIGQEQQQAAEQQRQRDILGAAAAVHVAPEERKAEIYQMERQGLLSAYPDLQLPEQYDPALVQSVVARHFPQATQVEMLSPADPVKIGARDRLVDPRTGREVVQAQPESFTLSPGQTRFHGGRPVASAPRQPGEAADQRDRKIRDLMGQGVDRERAVRLVDRHERVEIVPETGMARKIDAVGQTVEEIPIGQLSPGERSVATRPGENMQQDVMGQFGLPPELTMWDVAEYATGPASAIRAAAAPIGDIFGLPRAERTTKARQVLRLGTRELVRGLVNNPRFPVAEVERILDEVSTEPRVWDSPGVMRDRMESIDNLLRRRMETSRQDARDPNLPSDTRSAQAQNARMIENFLPLLGVPSGEQKATGDDIQDLLDRYAPE